MRVAVYGTLRRGGSNHQLLEGQTFIGQTTTAFNCDMFSLGAFPFIELSRDTNQTPVVVEVYEISEDCLRSLDRLEGYPSFYNRTLVNLAEYGQAWIYHMDNYANANHRSKLIPSGDWLQRGGR